MDFKKIIGIIALILFFIGGLSTMIKGIKNLKTPVKPQGLSINFGTPFKSNTHINGCINIFLGGTLTIILLIIFGWFIGKYVFGI